MTLYYFHLWNNYSGSSVVLGQVIDSLKTSNLFDETILVTSKDDGPLSHAPCKKRRLYVYKGGSKLLRKLAFFYSSLFQLGFILLMTKKCDVLYFNTHLYAPLVLIVRRLRPRIVWHLHEDISRESWINKLVRSMNLSRINIISVSEYATAVLDQSNVDIVPNFFDTGLERSARSKDTILFVGSTAYYKGFEVFINLAKCLPNVKFQAVLSDMQTRFIVPDNLDVVVRPKNIAPYYERAIVTLNLTNPDLVRETFGMTILEAIRRDCAVLYPAFGGIAETFNSYEFSFPCRNPWNVEEVKSIIEYISKVDSSSIAFAAEKFLLNVDEMKTQQSLLHVVSKVKDLKI